jgi:uncharacterized protein YjbJ (UPF0337 family)
MTATKSMHHIARRARGKALEIRGRATGNRRTRLRGRALQLNDRVRTAGRRLGRNLRAAAHK